MKPGNAGRPSPTIRFIPFLTLLFLPFLASCGDGGGGTEPTPPPTPVATTVAVSPSSATLQAIGATVQLSATVRDQNGQVMTGASVSWSSSDNGVATVSSGGLGTAVSAGPATITATSGQASGTVSVTVTQVVTSVAVSPASHTMVAGEGTVQFTASVKDANGHAVHGAGVSWSSSDPSRVSVNAATGLATPLQPGPVTITATSGGVSGTASVTVLPRPVATVEVNPSSGSILVGGTLQLTATTRDGAGNVLTGREITWSSSDTTVVKVSSGGLVTGMKLGMATVTASSEGKSGSASVIVVPPPVASVEVSPSSGSILVGATLQLAATTRDDSGNLLTGRTVIWTSSDTTVAMVSSAGLVTGMKLGMATVTATSEGKNGSAMVTVMAPPVASVGVTPSSGSILVGGTLQLTATTRDGAGNVLTGREITWSSSDLAVASVSSTGRVTGLKAGTSIITASSEGKTGSAPITVVAPVTSVVVQGIFRVKVGDTYTYTATARLADGTVVQRPITWRVLETTKGSMTPDGSLTPLQTGVITIVATIDGVGWEVTVDAYDWTALTSATSLFVFIDSDTRITNKWGTSEYPELVFSCNATSGKFFAWVDTDYFVTQNGGVTYQFDSGTYIHQTWIEFDNYSALGHPGPSNLQTKNFAGTMALARRFGFAFTEFNGPAKATIFRVTGLAPFLSPLFNACPSNSLVADQGAAQFQVMQDWSDLRARGDAPALVRSEQGLRGEMGPQPSSVPELIAAFPALQSRTAVRKQ